MSFWLNASSEKLSKNPSISDERFDKSAMIGRLEEAVLVVLLKASSELTALGVHAILADKIKTASSGAIYVTLDRLLRKDMVCKRKGDPTPERGGKAQSFYEIADAGREALKEARAVAAVIDSLESSRPHKARTKRASPRSEPR